MPLIRPVDFESFRPIAKREEDITKVNSVLNEIRKNGILKINDLKLDGLVTVNRDDSNLIVPI